jgi:hypothetical protein
MTGFEWDLLEKLASNAVHWKSWFRLRRFGKTRFECNQLEGLDSEAIELAGLVPKATNWNG